MLDTHLAKYFCEKQKTVEEWFANAFQNALPPVYGSVDLRYAGFKISPIDMNLFPAGFNNLSDRHIAQAVVAAKQSLLRHVPRLKRLLLIPESHTRNAFYWKNVQRLQMILEEAGFEVSMGFLPEVALAQDAQSPVIERVQHQLQLPGFVPDAILLNNDLAEGIPDILRDIQQPMLPSVQLGWSQRFKSTHFTYYQQLADEFAHLIALDPWLIAPLFAYCEPVDFMRQEGMAMLIEQAEHLFEAIQAKYRAYHISQKPFLIIKADQGTYGMAVMTVRDIAELKQLNRKKRTQMSATKGAQPVRRVILQEGVYTFETVGPTQAVAEPVAYLFGEKVVGGFYRVHQTRGIDENLNAPGMHFEPLPFSPSCADEARIYLYSVIARLSMLAAAQEIKYLFSGK